jgi:hypothetical protein
VKTNKLNKYFSKYRKKFCTALVIWELQIKTTVRFHLIPVRISVIKEKNVVTDVQKREFLSTFGSVNYFRHYGNQYGGSSIN